MSASSARRVVPGIAASHGVAVGVVQIAGAVGARAVLRRLSAESVEAEVERLRAAIEESRREIEQARDMAGGVRASGEDWSLILDAHLLMHRDELVVDATVDTIRSQRVNAEWALSTTSDSLRQRLLAADSDYFRERAQDVEHVAQHIHRWLVGARSAVPHFTGPRVVVARDISPADAARLGALPVLALVTERGSTTSHTAILARAMGLPAVAGVRGIVERVANGDVLVVDALRGEVVLDPGKDECDRARERGRRHAEFIERLRARPPGRAVTADGTRVELLANLDLPAEAALLADTGAEGVGLYRTEFLYLGRRDYPSEEEQFSLYRGIVEAVAPQPVTFRTCDLGADKMPMADRRLRSANPALGLRGLRYFLARPDLMRVQVRAILRASQGADMRVMLPLVTTVDEVRSACRLIDEEKERLLGEGARLGSVPVGLMIEVPAAALLADVLVKECDFFSVGTNDLVQYTMAADRGDPNVAPLARALDPAVLRLLDGISRAALPAGLPMSMCGDMAADPLALPVVLGLGFRSLSVPPTSLPLVREVVSIVDASAAARLAADVLELERADDVQARIIDVFAPVLGEIWEEEGVARRQS